MSYPSLNEVSVKNGKVVLQTRYWDGIDRSDYVQLEPMTPEQAQGWADSIAECAATAKDQSRERDAAILAEKAERLVSLKEEVDRLERELSGA